MIHPCVTDFIKNLNLKQDDKVQLYLSSEEIGTARYGSHHQFSLEIDVNNQYKERKNLAEVIRADISYGDEAIKLLRIARVLEEGKGKIIEPFMKVPTIGLESKMSSNSILYVFSGLIEHAQACKDEYETIEVHATRHLLTDFKLNKLLPIISGIYQGEKGYSAFRDLELLRDITR
ncbi:MAG: hypothetical protein ABH824_03885 [Nanoarchaeota archaeon]|nr:hypothetical protein [Nanoarchaeota archaeon]MBU1631586.1 hypothetical protein [Nanoarchaeota archaeon]MBU1876118.1 hypothetical protein [Nanoarchaeota archaeon]